jgi:hypothetical protein
METIPNKGQQVILLGRTYYTIKIQYIKLQLFLLSCVGVKLKFQATGIDVFEDRMLRIEIYERN